MDSDKSQAASPWSLDATREFVAHLYGEDQLELVRESLNSIAERQMYVRIHFQEAKAVLDKYLEEILGDASLLFIVFGGDEEKYKDYALMRLRVSAYIVALIESLDAVLDIFAHALYFALGLNLDSKLALNERDITLVKVRGRIESIPDGKYIVEQLAKLTEGQQYAHARALANHCKHRSVVRPSLNEDATGKRQERHQLMLSAFEYNETRYPEVAAYEFLEAEYKRRFPVIADAGNALNAALASRIRT